MSKVYRFSMPGAPVKTDNVMSVEEVKQWLNQIFAMLGVKATLSEHVKTANDVRSCMRMVVQMTGEDSDNNGIPDVEDMRLSLGSNRGSNRRGSKRRMSTAEAVELGKRLIGGNPSK